MAQEELNENINARLRPLIVSLETMLTELYALTAAAEVADITAYDVAGLPAAAAGNLNKVVYVSDGAAGSPTLAVSDGSAWKVAGTLGATCSAT